MCHALIKLGDVEGILHIEYEKLSANSLYFSQFFRLLVGSAFTTDLNTSVHCHILFAQLATLSQLIL